MFQLNLRVLARASAVLALAMPGVPALAATAQPEAALSSWPTAVATAVGGLVLATGAAAALISLRARDGKQHWLTTNRHLEVLLPVSIVGGLVFGIAMLIAGISNMVN